MAYIDCSPGFFRFEDEDACRQARTRKAGSGEKWQNQTGQQQGFVKMAIFSHIWPYLPNNGQYWPFWPQH